MQFIKPDINLEIIGRRKFAFALSAVMIIVSIGALAAGGGPRYGIDFAGGTLIQVRFDAPVEISVIKKGLDQLQMGNSAVQQFGEEDAHEVLIRTDQAGTTDKGFNAKLRSALAATSGAAAEIRRVEMVGPQVGKDLREKALKAMFYALLFITVYISG
ncbi:MAG: protein translocase subunit SecF, partial [Desulfobacterales bacterium]|nr:protein translocase subunit SecF [Desulfobacterales bacterium]